MPGTNLKRLSKPYSVNVTSWVSGVWSLSCRETQAYRATFTDDLRSLGRNPSHDKPSKSGARTNRIYAIHDALNDDYLLNLAIMKNDAIKNAMQLQES